MMKWYLEVLSKYAVFTGRARRREFWFFILFSLLVTISLNVIESVFGLFPDSRQSVLVMMYNLIVFLPSLGVTIRRLHDTGRSGAWVLTTILPILLAIPVAIIMPPAFLFLGLVLFVGAFLQLVFMVQDSTPGPNEYGENPKEAIA